MSECLGSVGLVELKVWKHTGFASYVYVSVTWLKLETEKTHH